MSDDWRAGHLRFLTLRSFRSSFLHLRWLACLLAVLLLFGQQGALRHALSHWNEGDSTEFSATANAVGAERGKPVQEHTACLQCAAFAALAAALPMLLALRLRSTRRWHFPHIGFHAGAPVFPVAVCSRDPPFRL